MNKEQLVKYKKKLSELTKEEEMERKLDYLRNILVGNIAGPITGYASIDMPWLGYYPKELYNNGRKKYNKVIDYIKDTWKDNEDDIMIHYYGSNITAKDFFEKVEATARSLKSLGLNKNDTIITDLEGVPEFIYLFFASELIGVNVKNKIGASPLEIAEVINESQSKYLFTHDYLSKQDEDIILSNTNLNNIIIINPVEHLNGDISNLRPNIKKVILSKYHGDKSHNDKSINWKQFLELDRLYGSKIYVESEDDTKLFSAFTSGSTGARKEVIHTSKTILEMLDQMIFDIENKDSRQTWLWPIVPPSLVAVVIAYMCMPLAQGKRVILDPYFEVKDIDLEIMRYKPNSTGLVPVFIEELISSKRISKETDMSYLKILGFGAEPLSKNFIDRIESFLKEHNCNAPLNGGYGNSEGGSQMTIAFNNDVLRQGSVGFPLINTTISIFKPDTEEELEYGQIGEICKSGDGIMLGYSKDDNVSMNIKVHSDGKKWLHTKDFGYITKEGFLYVVGREGIKVYSKKEVYPLAIESKVSQIEGVKNAIVVSGDSKKYEEYQAPYLFIVPFEGIDYNELLSKVELELKNILLEEEYPEEIHIIDEKPVSHFKVDKKILSKKYNITNNNK